MQAIAAVKVVDASALAAIVFDEPAGDDVTQRLRGCSLVAPSLLHYEMANICWVKFRRKPDDRALLLRAFRMPGFTIETIDVDHAAIIDLAVETDLTTYDASYLWLARDLDAELVTLDRQLAAAAEKLG